MILTRRAHLLLLCTMHHVVSASLDMEPAAITTMKAEPREMQRRAGIKGVYSCKKGGSSCGDKIINIIGLFAMKGVYPAGLSYLPAALLAMRDINEKHPDILPGYKLKINAHDTHCNESLGLDAFYAEVYNPNRKSIMTLGGTCSPVTEATAQVSGLWGLKQISYSAVSPHLSNKEIFPSFFRVMTPEQTLTVARVKLFKQLKWRRVHIIYQNYKIFSTLDEYMKQDLRGEGFDVVSGEMFTNDPTNSVQNLKANDARIIIASMYEDKARQVMCVVYNLVPVQNGTRAWYKKLVWILPSFYDRHWMDMKDTSINCTAEQIREVVGNYFTVGSQAFTKDKNFVAANGKTPVKFSTIFNGTELYEAVREYMPPEFLDLYNASFYEDGSLYDQHRAPEAYDAVWAIALALNNTLTYLIKSGDSRRLEDFTYRDWNFSNLLQAGMMNVSFKSLSGPFFFNSKGERTPGIEILRFNNDKPPTFSFLGTCHLDLSGDWNCSLNTDKINWTSGQRPVDGLQFKLRTVRIDSHLRYIFWTLSSLGIVLSIGLLGFNIAKRSHRIIKMSSPRLNNIILVGCMVAYSTIYLLDVEGKEAQPACVIRTFTIVFSFSLSFGALFAKTWRVYEIFTAGHKVLSTRMLRDSSLLLIVAALVVINTLTLAGWVVASPQEPTLVNISTTAPNSDDIAYINQFQRCDSTYRLHFLWALISIQGVVILLGTFLAVQTRKVSCPELNDSKWIALCIYNVVVLSPVGVVVVMATEDKPEINYALESSMILLVTTMTQCLIFVPKIVAYRRHNRSKTSSSKLDFKMKLRRLNNVFTLRVVDRGPLSKRGSDASTSCEASQQTEETDESSVAGGNSCRQLYSKAQDPVKKSQSLSPTKQHFMTFFPLKAGIDVFLTEKEGIFATRESSSGFRTVKANLERGAHRTLHFKLYEKHILPRWKSEPNVCHVSGGKCPPHGDERLHLWRDERKDQTVNCPEKVKVTPSSLVDVVDVGCSTMQHDGLREIVVDEIKLKADVKLSSRLGFKASRRDELAEISQAEQIREVLSRLREAVDSASGLDASGL